MTDHLAEVARSTSFNLGCQARLDGRPAKPPPHLTAHAAGYWLDGWWDVDRHWGSWSLSQSVAPLPPVREYA